MRTNPKGIYLFDDLKSCCEKYFSWDMASCVGPSIGTKYSDLYYPDWEGDNEGCLNNGMAPSYMMTNPSAWMHKTLRECCKYFSCSFFVVCFVHLP